MSADHVLVTFEKTPDEVLPYSVDYSDWLDETSDTISTSAFTVDSGITLDSESNTATKSTVVISGGTAGTRYKVTSKIVTTGGSTKQKMFYIYIVSNR